MHTPEAMEAKYPSLFGVLAPFVYEKTLKEPADAGLGGVFLAGYVPTPDLGPKSSKTWRRNEEEMIKAFSAYEVRQLLEELKPIVIKVFKPGQNNERDILLSLNRTFKPAERARPVRLLCHGSFENKEEQYSFVGLEYISAPFVPFLSYLEKNQPLPLLDLFNMFKEITGFAYAIHKNGINHGNLAGGENADHLMWDPFGKRLRVLDWDCGGFDRRLIGGDQEDVRTMFSYALSGAELSGRPAQSANRFLNKSYAGTAKGSRRMHQDMIVLARSLLTSG